MVAFGWINCTLAESNLRVPMIVGSTVPIRKHRWPNSQGRWTQSVPHYRLEPVCSESLHVWYNKVPSVHCLLPTEWCTNVYWKEKREVSWGFWLKHSTCSETRVTATPTQNYLFKHKLKHRVTVVHSSKSNTVWRTSHWKHRE